MSVLASEDVQADIADRHSIILVLGAEGTPEYGRLFATWQGRWVQAAERAGAKVRVIGRDNDQKTTDLERLRGFLDDEPNEGPEELWLVLIGHGTHDGHRAHQLVLVRSEQDRRIPPELLAERNRLELAVTQLREQKSQLAEQAYYDQLERLLLELARLQEKIAPPR